MRSRAYRRHQRARIKARHLRDYRRLMASTAAMFPAPDDIATRHPLDCGRRCELCHGDKFDDPRRAREKRQWKGYVDRGGAMS